MSKNGELVATFSHERVVFQDETPEERTVIGELDDGTVIKGRSRLGELQAGLTYTFFGHWTVHDRYGRQFHFNSHVVTEPHEERGIVKYLQRAPGIGPAIAQSLWGNYSGEAVKMLRERPEECAKDIAKLSTAKALNASRWLEANFDKEKITIDLVNLLSGQGFPRGIINSCISKWGAEAPRVIKENPFALMIFKGVGFRIADNLWNKLGLPMNSMDRQVQCVAYAAKSADGHTWIPRQEAEQFLRGKLAGSRVDCEEAINQAIEGGLIHMRGDSKWLADASKADNESSLANSLNVGACEIDDELGLPDKSKLRWPSVETMKSLTDHQRHQLAKAMSGRIGILTGAPGCGKTFALAQLVKAIGESSYCVCAPTGKAAVRVSESLSQSGVRTRARTIHSILQVQSAEGGWQFVFGEGQPLPYEFIFVDESSLIDTDLMKSLLAARGKGAHMLFVGDPWQLPPVGHGAPFRDFQKILPSGHLAEPMRNSGRIVRTCLEVRRERKFNASPSQDLGAESPENLLVVDCKNPQRQVEELLGWLMQFEGDRIWDVQVICALNKTSPVSRKPLNERLQNALNPNGKRVATNPFRAGDKVINTKNGRLSATKHHDGLWEDSEVDDEGKCYAANGEQGLVLDVEPKRTIVQLRHPDRCIVVPHGQVKESEEEGEGGCAFELGYAISAHKSQGSEWPLVLVIIDESRGAGMLCDAHWVTTAISRARHLCVCIGRLSTVRDFVRRSNLWRRKTFLVEKVRELQGRGTNNEVVE